MEIRLFHTKIYGMKAKSMPRRENFTAKGKQGKLSYIKQIKK